MPWSPLMRRDPEGYTARLSLEGKGGGGCLAANQPPIQYTRDEHWTEFQKFFKQMSSLFTVVVTAITAKEFSNHSNCIPIPLPFWCK